MVGHPGMLHERRGGRSTEIIMAWMAWKRVQPESVQMGYSRPRYLSKAANPTAWCTMVRAIPLQNLKSMDTNTQIPQPQACGTQVLLPIA